MAVTSSKKPQRDYGPSSRAALTSLQLERILQDLLAIDIPLAMQRPDEPRTNGFSTVASGQTISHFELQTHLAVVDAALDEAFRSVFLSRMNHRSRLPHSGLFAQAHGLDVGNRQRWTARPWYGRVERLSTADCVQSQPVTMVGIVSRSKGLR